MNEPQAPFAARVVNPIRIVEARTLRDPKSSSMTDLFRREAECPPFTASDSAVNGGKHLRIEAAWLTQKALAELISVGVPDINKPLKNAFNSGELAQATLPSILGTTAADHKARGHSCHSFNASTAVGYCVNGIQPNQFRTWAAGTLPELMDMGFVPDDDLLQHEKAAFKQGYIDELLEQICESRAIERRFHREATELQPLASDYASAKGTFWGGA